jgi:hypothetical protein
MMMTVETIVCLGLLAALSVMFKQNCSMTTDFSKTRYIKFNRNLIGHSSLLICLQTDREHNKHIL